MEHFQYGKHIGKLLITKNRQKPHRAPKHILLGLKSEKYGNQVPHLDFVQKTYENAHKTSRQNGCDTFPNELTRFRIEAKTIWDKIQKHFKNAVIN